MTTKVIDRQYALSGLCALGIANIGAGNGYSFALPPKASLIAVDVYVDTAFNSGTTATATVGDGTTTFANAVDMTATGSKTVTNTPKFYPSGGTITVTMAQTGTAATAGSGHARVSYVIDDRGGEIQG